MCKIIELQKTEINFICGGNQSESFKYFYGINQNYNNQSYQSKKLEEMNLRLTQLEHLVESNKEYVKMFIVEVYVIGMIISSSILIKTAREQCRLKKK